MRGLKWGAVLAIATAIRLVSWPQAPYAEPSLSPFDGDCQYHRLRAEQIARSFPSYPSRDPDLGGGGIEIPWPPLFDEIIAATAVAVDRHHLERSVALAAAWVPVVVGVATVPVVGWLAGLLLGAEFTFGAALILALSTPHALYSLYGRSDQHVLELCLTVSIVFAYAKSLRAVGPPRRIAAALGLALLICLSFWNWLGSALNLLFLGGFTGVWHLLATPEEPRSGDPARTLATGAGAGALLLAVSIALFGPPGALGRTSILGITGLHVLLTAGTSIFGAVLWCAHRFDATRSLPRKIGHLIFAGAVPLVLAASSSGIRNGIEHGLLALSRGNRWYASIGEFAPMLFSGHEPLWEEAGHVLAWFGLVPAAAALGAYALPRVWREGERRPEALLLASWAGASFLLALARYRFALYASAPLAVLGSLGIQHARRAWVPRYCRRAALDATAIIVMASAAGVLVKPYLLAPRAVSPGPLLSWVRAPAYSPDAEAIYARWSWGHHVRALSRRPAVANPFGTEGGAAAFEESLRTFLSTDEEALLRVLRARHAGYLLNENPRSDVEYQAVLASGPVLADVQFGWLTGVRIVEKPRYFELVTYRLYALDGSASDGLPALTHFRVLRETEPLDRTSSDRPAFTLYGVVAGARVKLRGAPPGAEIAASMRVHTNTGREFLWQTRTVADASGCVELRVPYATGTNGSSVAERFEITAGDVVWSVPIPERAVVSGEVVPVDVHGSPARRGGYARWPPSGEARKSR